jgi:hypothetical protein
MEGDALPGLSQILFDAGGKSWSAGVVVFQDCGQHGFDACLSGGVLGAVQEMMNVFVL